ncbi:MAG: hypothetical protein JRZ94_06310 [Nitrososphaerota archaeon]|nr:hypothetical protein [Nitrososphaerota archaeon]
MTEWHPITAKFSTEEKKLLDTLRDVYGLNYNQSLKVGIELLSRLIAMCEYYATADGDIIKKVTKAGKRHMKQLDNEVKKILEDIPIVKQESEYEKLSTGADKMISHLDDVFVKNRKRGRKPSKTKRGRPSTKLG